MNESFEQLWEIKPLGNKVGTKSEYDYIIATKKATHNDLIDKFTEYLAFCKFTERPEKYVKGLMNFLRDSDYNGSWKVPEVQRTIQRLSSNEPIDPPVTRKPKPYGAHLQRSITGPDGKGDPKDDGNSQVKGSTSNSGNNI
jgi:hypothetical protein